MLAYFLPLRRSRQSCSSYIPPGQVPLLTSNPTWSLCWDARLLTAPGTGTTQRTERVSLVPSRTHTLIRHRLQYQSQPPTQLWCRLGARIQPCPFRDELLPAFAFSSSILLINRKRGLSGQKKRATHCRIAGGIVNPKSSGQSVSVPMIDSRPKIYTKK